LQIMRKEGGGMKWCLMICLVIAQYTAMAQNCNLTFKGHVTDVDTKEILSNAAVTLVALNKTVLTNKDGDFRFAGLCKGAYVLMIVHVSCDTLMAQVEITGDLHRDFTLSHASKVLGNVMVTASGAAGNAAIKDQVSGRALEQTRGFSLAEALSKSAGVTMLQTGSTISKPVIHGLHSNRLLILNNGVRQEGQQWGSEHAPEIDPFIAGSLTVIKGAGSLRYGSDAIAGAVLVEPRPLPTAGQLYAEFNTAYHSNNRLYLVNGVAEQNLKKLPALSWRLQGTFKQGGNTRTPGYWLSNTGLKEHNYSVTVGWRKSKYQSEVFFSSFNTTLGIFSGSHIGNITDLENAIASETPLQNINAFSYTIERPRQEVAHYLFKIKNSFILPGNNRLTVVLAHQENFRKEFDRALITNRPELDLNIGTTTADISLERRKHISTSYGLFAMRQQNVWEGSRFFIPNFLSWNMAAYAIAKADVSTRLKTEVGARYDFRTLETFRNSNGQQTKINRQFNNVSATGLLEYAFTPRMAITGTASVAWRPPQVNELYVNGLHHGTASYEIGDPDLANEVAYNFSAQLKHRPDSLMGFDITVYGNYIYQYINLVPVQPPTLTLRGAYPTFRYVQTNAFFYGADFSANRQLTQHLNLSAKTALIWARDVVAATWVQQVPSHRLEAEATYSFTKAHPQENFISVAVQHVTQQTRVSGAIKDYLPPPAAYTLVNLESGIMFHLFEKRYHLNIGVRNLLNKKYRDYMNRFRYFNDEAGLNIITRIKFQI